MFFVAVVCFVVPLRVPAQSDITDADLTAASNGRVVRVGSLTGGGPVTTLPLEVYVARVLAGEAEPRAAEAAYQALAVAIRTFALFNAGRHDRDGFDLCDTTHCQVPRAASVATRRAALATAGQVLTWNGAPAELFYSASCGGRSASASEVWPAANYPYLRSVEDQVHDDDEPWVLDLTLREVHQALGRAGFGGQRLRDVRVDGRSPSGRATRLELPGLRPDVIAGEQFRAAIGANVLRSTAFSIQKRGASLRFTGRGFGHGVGMCVIGAGRRASRGEDVRAILSTYYPGLELVSLEVAAKAPGAPAVAPPAVAPPATAPPATAPRAIAPPAAVPPAAFPRAARGLILVRVPPRSALTATELERLAGLAQGELSKTLGTSVAPITIQLHESLESFRLATGKPWWVSAVANATSIDLAPADVLAQRDGVEAALRTAVAELLVAESLAGRPAWVRVGAARYFGRQTPRTAAPASRVRCPSDAELTLAISVTAQRDAEARAEACFAREYASTRDWRSVR